ncbi:disks large-associated protein 5 isoform X1 [Pleurodeles waltl]
MDSKSEFTARYKKDLSTEILRAKVARRKSLTQKENRHKEFRKSRRLALADINISPVKEIDLSTLDSNEDSVFKKDVDKVQKLAKQRIDLLQRFKEEKQLRKLKEQRDQAKRGIFKCGIYKHDAPLPSFPQTQPASQVKPEKAAPFSESKVTRSKARPILNQNLKTQRCHQSMVNQSFSGYKANPDHLVQPVRKETASSRKRTEKENLVIPTAVHTRTTRVPVAAATRPTLNRTIVTTVKPVQKLNTGIPQRKTDPKEKSKVSDSKVMDTKTVKLQKKPKEEVSREPTLPRPNLTLVERMEKNNLAQKVEESSFAPLNFQFQPLDGISTYKLKPMTPHSTNAFLNPCFTWSPANMDTITKISDAMEEGGEIPACPLSPASNLGTESTSSLSSTEQEGPSEMQQMSEPAVELSVPVAVSETAVVEKMSKHEEIKHDVPYFRDTLRLEIERLTLLCVHWEQSTEMTDGEIPEDAKALIRTTVGQTRLLIAERFKQFEGLVDDCEFKRGEKETTCTDLDGFWDMINFQVEDVLKKFADLDKLKENAWQQVNIQAKKVKKKMAPVAASKPNQGDNARTAARNRLAAIKAAMKNKMKQEDILPESSDSQATKDANIVVFDAGFFKVESPAKSIQRPSSKVSKSSLSQSIGAELEGSVSKVSDLQSIEPECVSGGQPEQLSETANLLLASVKKVLFGSTDNLQSVSRADEVCPMVEELDPTLLPVKADSANEEQLPANVICTPGLGQQQEDALKPATDNPEGDVIESLEYPKMQADVMCSPPSASVTMTGESEMLATEKPDWAPRNTTRDICHDPLDFLSGTPPNLAKFQTAELTTSELPPAVGTNDLIVFSPVTM